MKKKTNKNGIFYVVISLVAILAVGTGVFAYAVSNNVNVSGDYNYYEAEGQPAPEGEPIVGGTIGSDIYHDVVFHGETQIDNALSDIDVRLDLRPSTTATTLRGIAAQYKNDSVYDKICFGSTLIVDFHDAVTGFGSSFTVGITTPADGLYLTATTSAQLIASTYVATTTEGMLTPQVLTDYTGVIIGADSLASYWSAIGGTAYATGTQPFLLKNGEVLVVAYDYSGATSTNSWTDGEGSSTERNPGRLHVDCINRKGNN